MEKNRYLNQLLEIIQVLRGSEKDIARKHLKAYETNHTVNNRKMFQLYKYIIIKQIADYDRLKKRISPDSTDDSFNKLIRRTMDRIQESLIIDVNIRRKGSYSDLFRMKFFIRKLIMEGMILLGRGLRERALSLFETCIRYSKKYELYDELIEALNVKQSILLNKEGSDAFEKMIPIIDYYENCRHLLIKAKRTQRLFEAKITTKSNVGRVSQYLRKQVELLHDYSKQTDSANILTFYYLLKIDINKADGNMIEASKNSRALINLLKSSPAVYSKPRIGFILSELVSLELNTLKFKEAIIVADETFNWLSSKNLLYLRICVKKQSVLVLKQEYSESLEWTQRLDDFELVDAYPLYKARIIYHKAITYFGLLDFKKALELLSEKMATEKDKEGWNVWIRIMRLLCSIEMLKLNLIDYDIESFRKYLQRISKQYEVRLRDKLILQVLLELDRQNYDFEATAERRASQLDKLKSTDKRFAWNPDSPEMILFHDWFEAKREQRDYKPNFEVYRKTWNKSATTDLVSA